MHRILYIEDSADKREANKKEMKEALQISFKVNTVLISGHGLIKINPGVVLIKPLI